MSKSVDIDSFKTETHLSVKQMLVLAIIKGDVNDDTLYLQLECRRRFTRRPPVNFYTTYEAIKAKWLFLHKLLSIITQLQNQKQKL